MRIESDLKKGNYMQTFLGCDVTFPNNVTTTVTFANLLLGDCATVQGKTTLVSSSNFIKWRNGSVFVTL